MKELSIEEKAKRYDEALKQIKECTPDENGFVTIYPDEIFPELKESEDEKIRKEIIKLVKFFYGSSLVCKHTISKDKMVAWLEKQGNEKDIHLLELKAQAYDDAKERMSYAYNQNRVPIGFISEIFPNLNSYEKQSEQKPADKVESKFKVGDWVSNGACTWRIDLIENDLYCSNCDKFTCGGDIKSIDEQYHLWTIEDANDGDVLCLGGVIAIFKKYIGQEKCICYCSFCDNGSFEIPIENGEDNVYGCTDTTPANKEQRDILFAKMHEAGYEWNADEKVVNMEKRKVIMTKEELLKKVHDANKIIYKHGKNHKFSYTYVKVLLNDIELSVRELNNGTN